MKTRIFKAMATMLLFFGILVVTLPAYALPFRIEGAVGVWNHDPNGMINYNGDDIELNNDLSLGDRNDINVWFRIEHPVPLIPDLKVQYTPIKVKDSNSISRKLSFGDHPFENAINSELELDILDVQLYNHLPFLEMASLEMLDITYGLNLRLLNANAFIEEVQTLNARSKSFSTPLAMLSVGFRIAPVSSFSLVGELKGTAYSGNHWYDATAGIQVAPFIDFVFLGVGYRYQDYKMDDIKDVTADQTMQGWFAELGFRLE